MGISAYAKAIKPVQNLPKHFDLAKIQIMEYFAGKRKTFDLPLIFPKNVSKFRLDVWHKMAQIPFGSTKSYKDLAVQVKNPNAARAVGGACNKNAFLIVLPCHRVIGSGGSLTGFALGLDIKRILLKHEGIL